MTGVSAIEVYPAATLIAYGLPSKSYKQSTNESKNERHMLVNGLADIVEIGEAARNEMVARHDLLDAAVCVIAGVDFAEGNVVEPLSEEMEQARRAGWIWFKALRSETGSGHCRAGS